MKIKKMLVALSLAATAGIGLFAGLNSTKSETIEAKAGTQTIEDGTIEIRFTRPGDWGNNVPHIHTWNEGGSGTTWPGYAMTWLWDNEYGQAVFSWSPSSSEKLYGNIQFNNNNNGMQSTTLNAPSTSKAFWYDNGWQSGDVPTMDIYLYDYDNKFNGNVTVHAWRYNTTFANDAWPGNAATRMTSVATNGLIYKFTMNNRYDRVIFSANGSNQTGDLTPSGNYCYVLANNDTTLDGKNTWWNNINYVFAHNFSQNTMLMRSISTSDNSSTQQCASRYSTAKTAFNALKTSGYGTEVLKSLNNNFASTMTRLEKWAIANHETFDSGTGTFSNSAIITPFVANKDNSALIVTLISILTLISLGGFFFMKKKEESR